MSVEKMEQYKEYKKHRKEILRKQKMKERLYTALGITVGVVVVGVVGYFVYQDVKPEYKQQLVDLAGIGNYMDYQFGDGVSDDETEATTEESTDAESETTDK